MLLSFIQAFQPFLAFVVTVNVVVALFATEAVVNVPKASVPPPDVVNWKPWLMLAVTVIWSLLTVPVAQVPVSIVEGVLSWVVIVPVRLEFTAVGVDKVFEPEKLKQ